MSLTNQTTKINVVISCNQHNVTWCQVRLDYLKKTFDENFTIWCAIIHDKDTITNLDGVVIPKLLHIHFIGVGSRKRLLTYLNLFANWFECNTFAVQIEKLTDFTAMCQYLIHKNDLDKYQYSRERIYTNLPKDELDTTLNAELEDSLTADKLMFYIGTSNNLVELINRVGLTNFQHYHSTIKMLLDIYTIGFMQIKRKDLINRE